MKTVSIFLAALAACSAAFAQGPLAPPGPPGETMKTLAQLDAKLEKRTPISSVPFTITQSGSYYLTGNLDAAGASPAITIEASFVTLDLDGFRLTGTGTHGILASGGMVTVRNGSITGFGTAVKLQTRGLIEKVACSGPGGLELELQGVIRNSQIQTSLSAGVAISVANGGLVEGCLILLPNMSGAGIIAGEGCLIRECVVNGSVLTSGISIGSGTVADCSVEGCAFAVSGRAPFAPLVIERVTATNVRQGFIDLGRGTVVSSCSARGVAFSGSRGVGAGDDLIVRGVTVVDFADGFAAVNRAILTNCSASSCTTGYNLQASANLVSCNATNNFEGIKVGDGATVTGCNSRQNSTIAIKITGGGFISGNTCDGNGGAGIQATQGHSRIEGNHLIGNPIGILLNAAGNTVFRNSFRGNFRPFEAAAGNDIAPFSTAAAATNPFSNITF